MKRVSWVSGVGRVLSDWRPRRKASLSVAASTPPRPCRGKREHQPADDQKRAAGWCCHRKQAVAGILPQCQIAGEQSRGDDKAESGGDAYSEMDDAALGQRHRGEHG